MNQNPHSNNILLNLGIEALNEMQVAAQETILNDANVLLLSFCIQHANWDYQLKKFGKKWEPITK